MTKIGTAGVMSLYQSIPSHIALKLHLLLNSFEIKALRPGPCEDHVRFPFLHFVGIAFALY
jgi:hypothetical protein